MWIGFPSAIICSQSIYIYVIFHYHTICVNWQEQQDSYLFSEIETIKENTFNYSVIITQLQLYFIAMRWNANINNTCDQIWTSSFSAIIQNKKKINKCRHYDWLFRVWFIAESHYSSIINIMHTKASVGTRAKHWKDIFW